MNLVLITKWWWRCYVDRSSMWNTILSQRYGRKFSYNLENLSLGSSSSHMIRTITSIENLADMMELVGRNCFKWVLNNGERILFWEDWWHENGVIQIQTPRLYRITKFKHCCLKEFREEWNKGDHKNNSTLWSRPLIDRDEGEILILKNIIGSILLSNKEDLLIWTPVRGVFTTKKCRELLFEQRIDANNN
ncbi:hypothetical protein POM88_008367 [Heracleum sosnowskyi]|uniref:Uncharacterized protein n=1 Tax=Heracleum sosnowskyi TaxID=360622 RepID=A0AAD8J7W2_9APIA|nr:hypothetical protein POM88_008367 [Heracleum sosnowskyi]